MNEVARAYGQLVALNADLSVMLNEREYHLKKTRCFEVANQHFSPLVQDTMRLLEMITDNRKIELEQRLQCVMDKIPAEGITESFSGPDQSVAWIGFYQSKKHL